MQFLSMVIDLVIYLDRIIGIGWPQHGVAIEKELLCSYVILVVSFSMIGFLSSHDL